MGKGSAIEWTHHTFNPWIGCTKISPECARCYAEQETFVRVQRAGGRELWGPTGDRHITSDANWREPLKWDRAAAAAGERHRVFCASLSDVAEDRPDLVAPRARLCELILTTPNLDWLLLTKRLDDLVRLFPVEVLRRAWVGTTAGTKTRMLEEVQKLAGIPSRIRFISIEPLLEDVASELGRVLTRHPGRIDWVVAGGESAKPGDKPARPMHPAWARGVRDICRGFGVQFLFKQWGDFRPATADDAVVDWQFDADGQLMARVGKRAAGRLLDGRTWDEFPEARA